MYYLVFFILLFFSIIEVIKRRKSKIAFFISYTIMTIMTCLRYGQNADYFNYRASYLYPGSTKDPDPLFVLFQDACRSLGVSYIGLVMICGFIMMGLAFPFFYKRSKASTFSLLIMYVYVFLIYYMGVIRQGICISLLLLGFSSLLKGKKVWFYLIVFLGCFIHLSMIGTFIIGLLYDKKWFNDGLVKWIVLGMTCFAMITPDITSYIPQFLQGRLYEATNEGNTLAIAIRILLIIPLLLIKPPYGSLGYYAKSICIIGYLVYCLLSFSPLVAGRMESYFRIFFCLFISYVVFSMRRTARITIMLIFVIMIHFVLFFKNMNTAISQGGYRENKVNMFNYPYISIFEQSEFREYSDNDDPI